ncbi:MAG: hypothetical protein E6R08_00270 [Nevskiaceae bacterium]|nr:MAG: hypothetical protein E6R08_00270 [Nevskiaceae bacterium]
MSDAHSSAFDRYLDRLDLAAIESARDKVEECRFFLGLASIETDRARFRWMLSAFLNAAYSYFEMAALEAHFRFCDPDGNPFADEQTLATLEQHVKVDKDRRDRVKTIAVSPLAQQLFNIRKGNTHHFPLSIMEAGPALPEGFEIGRFRGEGVPALAFAREAMALVEQVQREIDE